MKKAVNVTTAIALALAASVTYNVVQHQRAKGIRPESPNKEENQPQTEAAAATEGQSARSGASEEAKTIQANKSASAAVQPSSISFKSVDYNTYYDHLYIRFSTPSSLQGTLPEDALEFTPAVSGLSFHTSGSAIYASGDFKSGVNYRVRVKKGLSDFSGKCKLEEDAVFDVLIPDLTEKFSFLTSGNVFPIKAGSVSFPYSSRNLKKLKVRVYRAFDNNMTIPSIRDSAYSMELIGEKTVALSDPRNETVNHMLDISDLLGAEADGSNRFRRGYHVLEVDYETRSSYRYWNDGYTYTETDRQRFMLTDLAMVAASVADAGGGIAVFVRGISTGEPVADAEVELTTSKNQLVQKAKTDSTGKALFNISNGGANLTYDKKGEIYSATIRTKDDFACYPLDLNIIPRDLNDNAFVFTERGIVRPGESFLAAAFIRLADIPGAPAKDRKAPSLSPHRISVLSPDWTRIYAQDATPDEAGFISQSIKIPDTAASGIYTVKVEKPAGNGTYEECGSTQIRVGAYVPDRIKTKVEHTPLPGGSAGEVAANEPIQAVLSADYYFGTPVPSASGRIFLQCCPAGYWPKHWNDWTVGDESGFKYDTYHAPFNIENGKAAFTLPSFKSRGVAFSPVRVEIQASVQEPGGRSVTGTDAFTLYPTDWFIGLKANEDSGKQFVLDVALLTPKKGEKAGLADGRDIKFTVSKRSWDYVLVQDGSGYRRRWQETVHEIQGAAKTLTIPADADLSSFATKVAFDLPSGCYDIVAEYGDGIRTKINVWHSAGESGRRTGNPSELVFKTDAEKYAPGGTAKITFTSPFDGEAFVAMGGVRLDRSEAIRVKAGENTVEAAIPADCMNGCYNISMIAVGLQDGEYVRASGDAHLSLDHSASHKLKVGIDLPETVRPETKADVTISLAKADGKPAKGQVCLFAVDEGVLALTGFKTPDIYRHFWESNSSFITMCETYSKLFPNLKIAPDGAIGGGDDAGSSLAASLVKMKEAVRIIAPAVVIPESGSATVNLSIPDHSGSLRFMAVASSVDAVGSGDREMIVRSPVGLAVSAPRVLAPGDEAVITVRAFNHDAKDGEATLDLALPDTIRIMGGKPAIGALKAGESKDVSFRVKATETTGEGSFAATLSVGPESRTETTFITVRPPNPPQTVTTFATVAPGKDFAIDLGGDFLSVKSSNLVVSSSPAISVKDALDWLNEYPYGCLEQTVSGAFPFIAADSLVKAGLIDAEVAKTMQPKVPAAYARILGMVAGDGAFAMWPDVRTEWPEGTVYAAHFIFEAKAAKLISVDAAVQRDVTAYLLRLANSAGSYDAELRAYATYALAAAGNKDFVIPARNILAGSKPGFAQFLAAAALIRGGYTGEGAEPFRQSLADASWIYGESPAVGMSDETSRAGMTLDILMKCTPKDNKEAAVKLATFLAGRIRRDGNCWGDTQSNAWACMGLAAFAKYYPPVELSGSVAAGGEKLALSGKSFDRPGLDSTGRTVVSNAGDADFFVKAVVKGVPKKAQTTSGPIKLNREFFDEKGGPVSSLKHGEIGYVRITVDAPDVVDNLVVSDILPAGLEIEDDELATRAHTAIPKSVQIAGRHTFDRTEKRDDRFLAFGTLYRNAYAIYAVRAVTPGKFAVPALHAEAMYDPDMYGTFVPPAGQDVFEVK